MGARREAERDFDRIAMISFDGSVAVLASDIAEQFGVKLFDAVHLASAKRLLTDDLAFITFDLRQASDSQGSACECSGAETWMCDVSRGR